MVEIIRHNCTQNESNALVCFTKDSYINDNCWILNKSDPKKGFAGEIVINFCPFCGINLEKIQKSDK